MNNHSIAFRIRKVREFRNYSQKYMARRLGITQSSYSDLEKGNTTLKEERLSLIAAVLEVSVSFLIIEDIPLLNMDQPQYDLRLQGQTDNEIEPLINLLKDELDHLRKQNGELVNILLRRTPRP